jgi:lysophospholipase L1-like esterase
MANRDIPVERNRRTRTSRHHRLRLASGMLALAVTLLLAACSGSRSGPAPAPTPRGPYVALGDSYTSGLGIPDQVGTPAGCDRSSRSYPALVAHYLKLGAGLVHDASCSGATTADLTAPQNTASGTNPAQLSALTAETALVTVGIGGNDLDFAGVLTRCVALDVTDTLIDSLLHTADAGAPCRAYYTGGGTDRIQQRIRGVSTQLAAALTRIRQLAPRARVYIVGYPDLLPAADGGACARILGVTAGDVGYLNGEEVQLNSMLDQQAKAAGDTYVGTYALSLGHDACSDPATRWIEPLIPDADAAPMHPNAAGQQGIADAVEQAITAGG